VGGAVIIVAIIPDFDTFRFVFLNFLFMPSSGIPHPLTLLATIALAYLRSLVAVSREATVKTGHLWQGSS